MTGGSALGGWDACSSSYVSALTHAIRQSFGRVNPRSGSCRRSASGSPLILQRRKKREKIIKVNLVHVRSQPAPHRVCLRRTRNLRRTYTSRRSGINSNSVMVLNMNNVSKKCWLFRARRAGIWSWKFQFMAHSTFTADRCYHDRGNIDHSATKWRL